MAMGAIMASKEISVKKYVVRLSGEEREKLEALVRKGKSPARRLLKARILLKADVSESGDGWSWGMLGKRVVELEIVDRASDSTIGGVLKKTFSSPIADSNGSSRRRPTLRS